MGSGKTVKLELYSLDLCMNVSWVSDILHLKTLKTLQCMSVQSKLFGLCNKFLICQVYEYDFESWPKLYCKRALIWYKYVCSLGSGFIFIIAHKKIREKFKYMYMSSMSLECLTQEGIFIAPLGQPTTSTSHHISKPNAAASFLADLILQNKSSSLTCSGLREVWTRRWTRSGTRTLRCRHRVILLLFPTAVAAQTDTDSGYYYEDNSKCYPHHSSYI